MIRQFCNLVFSLTGWSFKSQVPDELRSFVMLGAPHTSNFDFIPAMAVSLRMKRNAHFVIKNDWLKFPLNLVFKPIGAVGVDRSLLKSKANTTEVMASLFKNQSEFVLMISPEGTRSPVAQWKTGFYYIAQKANVPIVLGYADWGKKEAGLGPVIYPQDFETDMKKIMDFYKAMTGHTPQKFLPDQRFLDKE